MHAYYFNPDTNEDQRGEHRFNPNRPVDLKVLERVGVLYWRLDGEDRLERLDQICRDRQYKNRDEVGDLYS
jgi:1,2-dihydroxy-3-keto-5-methylthiopentene dioxygenase